MAINVVLENWVFTERKIPIQNATIIIRRSDTGAQVDTTVSDVNGHWGPRTVDIQPWGAGVYPDVEVQYGSQVRIDKGGAQVFLNNLNTLGAVTIGTGGLQVSTGNIGIGAAPLGNTGIRMTGSSIAVSGAVAYGIAISSTIVTTANGDALYGSLIQPVLNATSKTGVNVYGQYIDLGTIANWGQASTNGYGQRIVAPSGAAVNNIGLWVSGTPSGGTQNLGILVDGGGAQIAGGLAISGTLSSAINLRVAGVMSNSASQRSVAVGGTFGSSATTEGYGVEVAMATQAAAFTMANMFGIRIANVAKGAGSAITTQYGLLIDALTAGSTNNYGIWISAPSGGSADNVGLHTAGRVVLAGNAAATAGGNVSIGNATTATATAGGVQAVPATVLGYWTMYVGGTLVKVPYFAA